MTALRHLDVVQMMVLSPQQIELGCQLDHVVAVAALRTLTAEEHRGEVVPAMEVLPYAVAADRAAAPARDVVEEGLGCLADASGRLVFRT